MQIILASNSPRRTQILNLANIPHIVIPSLIQEKVDANLTPAEVVQSLAYQKAQDVAIRYPKDCVIGADTVVVIENEILGKPKDKEDAFLMLKKLSGKTHEVMTGLCLIQGETIHPMISISKVTFFKMTDEEIRNYIEKENVLDKAGSYAVQGNCCKYIKEIQGDYYTIMGLPIGMLYHKLKEEGYIV